MTQNDAILRIFLTSPNYKASNRYLRRICGFNEANARIVELNDEWREKGWDLRIVNTGERDGRFSIHQLQGDLSKLGAKRMKVEYVPVLNDKGFQVSVRKVVSYL